MVLPESISGKTIRPVHDQRRADQTRHAEVIIADPGVVEARSNTTAFGQHQGCGQRVCSARMPSASAGARV
jgi:hypothetical protein